MKIILDIDKYDGEDFDAFKSCLEERKKILKLMNRFFMGKSKKRNFNKNTDMLGSVIKRADVINTVLLAIKTNNITDDIKNHISLFGLTPEELTEAGASLEEIKVFKKFVIFPQKHPFLPPDREWINKKTPFSARQHPMNG